MLTANAIDGFRTYVKRTVAYAMYKIGSTYYKANLTSVFVDSDGKVAINTMLDPDVSGKVTVSNIRLYDTSGNLWLETAANVTRKSSQEGIYYRFTINIYET